jgi:chromate transporter
MPQPEEPDRKAGITPPFHGLMLYFFTLGSLGFGGPVALANHMRRGLVERRGWLTEEQYDDGLALAAICPGPIAYQLAVYCGSLHFGFLGGISVAFVFALTPFLLVVTIAHFYEQFASTWQLRGLFYGISPVVVALILRACWHLGQKTLRRDLLTWALFLANFALTIVLRRELTVMFLTAGVIGAFAFRPAPSSPRPAVPAPPGRSRASCFLVPAVAALPWSGTNATLFFFFFKAGLFMFGSGLVIVPFLKTYMVDQYHWIGNREFLDAVAIGMISPGPVAVSATFVSYLLNGFWGAVAATVGMFSPAVLFTVIAAPIFLRYRNNRRLQGFIQGVKVAVVGVLVGTTFVIGRNAIGDLFTVGVALATLALLSLFQKIPEPVAVAAGALIGLLAYPWLEPGWLLR